MEADSNEYMRTLIDEAFDERLRETVNGRIILAANALSEPLDTYRKLRDEQTRTFFAQQQFSAEPTVITGPFGSMFDYDRTFKAQHSDDEEVTILESHSELEGSEHDVDALAEQAERRLKAARAGIRAAYRLSRFQMFRATAYAKKYF